MSWVAGPDTMEEDVELEEGEAGYINSNDYRSIDPDIALSYIDEKLQSVLGHFQKDFEGSVSSDKLGAIFGAYGSFLPMYQRSPSIWSQQTQRVQSNITRSPDRLHREGAARSSFSIPDATSRERDGTAAPRVMHPLHDEKVTSVDDKHGNIFDLSSEQVAEKLPPRHQPSPNKSFNKSDKKTLKFRIKVSSDKAPQKNVEIYSGLGLVSPSSSHGNSPVGSVGVPSESRENSQESPTRILQMLSTLTVALRPLLSPLADRFLSLSRDITMEGKSSPALKDKLNHSATFGDQSNSYADDQDIIKGRKINTTRNCESVQEDAVLLRLKENSGAEVLDRRQCSSLDESQNLQSDLMNNTGGSLRNSSKQLGSLKGPEKGNLMKNRKINNTTILGRLSGADLVKDKSFESVSGQDGTKCKDQEATCSSVEKILTKNPPLEIPGSRMKKVNGMIFSSNMDSDIFESNRDSKGAADHLLPKAGLNATSNEQEKSSVPDYGIKIPSESKKKSKVSQVNGKLPSHPVNDGSDAGHSAVRKETSGSKKDTSKARDLYEDLFGEATGCCPVDPLKKPSNDGSKGPIDTIKSESLHVDRLKAKTMRKKVSNQQTSESLMKDPLNYSVPLANGLPLEMVQTTGTVEMDQTTSAPVWVEDWVQCDSCEKWRLLPYGRKPDQLPDKWICTMLDWLPGMNHCDISEDASTTALYASYQPLLPDNQNTSQYHADKVVTGANSVDAGHYNYVGNSDVNSGNVANGSRNKHKVKVTSNNGSKQGLIMTGTAMNFEQSPVRRETLNDKKQPNSGVKRVSNSIGQHRNSSHNAGEKHSNNQKLEHLTRGEAKLKRNSRKEDDQFEHPIAKRVKTGCTPDNIDSPISSGSLGRTGFYSTPIMSTVASVRDTQKSAGRGRSKDAKSEEGITLLPSGSKGEDTLFGGSLDVRRSSDSHMSLKKRKLMDWQNSQSNVEALKNGGHSLADVKIPVGEDSNSGVGRIKKPMVSQTDGNQLSRTKGNDEVTQKDMKVRMLASAVKDSRIDKDFGKEKQFREQKIKGASQLTMADLESLKKALTSEQVSAAATSSSSKVSDSRKTRVHYSENRGSPVESVSSSPLRMSTVDELSHNDNVKTGDFPTSRSPIKIENDGWDSQQSGKAKVRRPAGNGHSESFNNCDPSFRESEDVGHSVGNGLEANHRGTLEGHGPCLTDEPHSEPDKDGTSKKRYTIPLHHGKASSMSPKDKGRSSDLNSKETTERVCPHDRQGGSKPKKNFRVIVGVEQSLAASAEGLCDNNHQKSTSGSVKSSKVVNRPSKKNVMDKREDGLKRREHQNSVVNLKDSCPADATVHNHLYQDCQAEKPRKIFPVVDCGDEKPQVSPHTQDKHEPPSTVIRIAPGHQKKNLPVVVPHDVSGCREMSKESKDVGHAIRKSMSLEGSAHSAPDGPVAQSPTGPSFSRSNASVQSASVVLKEAEGFRDYADRLKETGFGYECNETYFQAGLKFLLGASLLERTNESRKHGEMNQMHIYISSAKLCETCAEEYERRQEMAAAALAYKCMEIAYMRVVYCKNVTVNRLCHDLRLSLKKAPQGESPSSSASDIDNLNTHALVDKSSLSKSNGTHVESHILASRSRSSIARLLDYTKEVTSAMEASKKYQNALAIANVMLEEAQNKEGIVSVKRVIDFSFQDVEELVRLVGLAKEAINRKAFCGSRN